MYKLASWNVNGLRACLKKGFLDWVLSNQFDLICLQEIKALAEQLPNEAKLKDYRPIFFSAQKKGYSGVAIYIKKTFPEPVKIVYGIADEAYDQEGRNIILEFENFILINCYFPNGQRDHNRVPYKLSYCQSILKLILHYTQTKKKPVIICGDFNTAHTAIDLKNPKGNIKTTGFLPPERAWLDELTQAGMIDIFRHFHPNQPEHYSWWSQRPGCREKNIGWRIDYFFVSQNLVSKTKSATIASHIKGSDHCPIYLEINL